MRNHYNPFARAVKPLRKILHGSTKNLLSAYVKDNGTREWVAISEIKEINGRFEVLVELQNDYYREYHGGVKG